MNSPEDVGENRTLGREKLEQFLEGEPVDSMRIVALADYAASKMAKAEIVITREFPDSQEYHEAIAKQAAVNETVRKREFSEFGAAYRANLKVVDIIWIVYYDENQVESDSTTFDGRPMINLYRKDYEAAYSLLDGLRSYIDNN